MKSKYMTTFAVGIAVIIGIGLYGCKKEEPARTQKQSRSLASNKVCGSNMAKIGRAILLYRDFDGGFPTPSKWCDLLIGQGNVTKEGFQCQGAEKGPCNYAMNKNVEKFGVKGPPDMVLLFETNPGWNQVGDSEILTTANHEDMGCNVMFLDGRVEFVKKQDLPQLKWTLGEAQQE